MKRFYLLSILMVMFTISANAQLEVNDDGKVAISATNSNFIPRLSVGDNCVFTTGTECNFGIAAAPLIQNNKKNIAVEGYVNSSQSFTSDTNVGVLGLTKLNPNHGRNFGVVGATDFNVYPTCVGGAGVYATNHGYYLYNPPTIQGTYALYVVGPSQLNGATLAQTIYTPADDSLSDNVESIERRDGETTLDNLMKMNVLEFNMKSREKASESKAGEEMTEEMKKSYESLKKEEAEMYSRRHFGLSAKELEKVYPNLVLKGQDGYQYINYTELVPILVRGIQELKTEVNELKAEVKELKAKCAGVEKTDIDELESEGIQISLK